MKNLANLKIIQSGLRNPEQIAGMIDFVKNGGVFDEEILLKRKSKTYGSLLIEIARFPDSELYIHNGHHRAVAICLAGRNYLYQEEYYIKDWQYEDYNEINFKNGYVTPFDIRHEARFPDIGGFKRFVEVYLPLCGEEVISKFIIKNRYIFCCPKKLFNVEDLANEYLSSSFSCDGCDMENSR